MQTDKSRMIGKQHNPVALLGSGVKRQWRVGKTLFDSLFLVSQGPTLKIFSMLRALCVG
jgi:hypothetical protein